MITLGLVMQASSFSVSIQFYYLCIDGIASYMKKQSGPSSKGFVFFFLLLIESIFVFLLFRIEDKGRV